MYILFNLTLCIHKKVRVTLSVKNGLKLGQLSIPCNAWSTISKWYPQALNRFEELFHLLCWLEGKTLDKFSISYTEKKPWPTDGITCSSSVKGWKARGRTGRDLQTESNISSSSGILTSSLNNASISSLPYRCSASLYLGPGEGGGDVTLFPLDKARSLER